MFGHPPNKGSFQKNNKMHWKGGVRSKDPVKYQREYSLNKRVLAAGRGKPSQCEVCGAMGRICYDHDHKTEKFRGWLCIRCNVALGMVKDDSELLLKLSEYLNAKNY